MHRIRKAEASDVPLILNLIRELAAYEREPEKAVATEEQLLRSGFGPEPAFHVLLAESTFANESKAAERTFANDSRADVAGFALYFYTFSTWRGTPSLYLEDLFIRPEHRRGGIGLAIMRKLASIAVERGCERFAWQVLDWNEPALSFYTSLGARPMRDWITMMIDGETLKALGKGA